jgi:hypothetical protein
VHIAIGPAKSSIGALLKWPECWLVCSMHSFNYLFKLSIIWPGGIILSNVQSNCGGGGRFVVMLFCCCCLFVYSLFCGYKVRRGRGYMCRCAWAFVSIALVSYGSGRNECRCLSVLFLETDTWNLTLHVEFNLCNWQIAQDTFFLSRSLHCLMYWSDKCRKYSTLSPADVCKC